MNDSFDKSKIRYVKTVTVGSINPNAAFSDTERDRQVELLNRCLSGSPRGYIIGEDKTAANYNAGGHRIIMEKTTYHVGFTRMPLMFDENYMT
jgi:hypothetical protein